MAGMLNIDDRQDNMQFGQYLWSTDYSGHMDDTSRDSVVERWPRDREGAGGDSQYFSLPHSHYVE